MSNHNEQSRDFDCPTCGAAPNEFCRDSTGSPMQVDHLLRPGRPSPNVPVSSGARLARYAEAMVRGKTEAETCRHNGWAVGTLLEGDEGFGPSVIQITAIGERDILAKQVSQSGKPCVSRENNWTLTCRTWRKVGQVAVADQETAELRAEVERLRGLVRVSHEDVRAVEYLDRAEAAEAESARLASVVAKVEALHRHAGHPVGGYCEHDGDPWPCATAETLASAGRTEPERLCVTHGGSPWPLAESRCADGDPWDDGKDCATSSMEHSCGHGAVDEDHVCKWDGVVPLVWYGSTAIAPDTATPGEATEPEAQCICWPPNDDEAGHDGDCPKRSRMTAASSADDNLGGE